MSLVSFMNGCVYCTASNSAMSLDDAAKQAHMVSCKQLYIQLLELLCITSTKEVL